MNWTAILSAIISVGSMATIALGHPEIGTIISNPNTATAVTAVVGGVAALVSAFSQGVQHPSTSVTVPAVAVDTSSPVLSPAQKSTVIEAAAKAS